LERGGIATRDKAKQRDPVETKVDLSLLKSDPNKLYPVIYVALKQTLADWGQWMDERPGMQTQSLFCNLTDFFSDSVKRTMQGKMAAATQIQSADYMKPLFKQLKARVGYHLPL